MSSSNNYYDLDDILTDAEKIPCRFNITVPGLGYLEGNPGKPIQKDTKVELPLWLAEILAILNISEESSENFIDLSDPDFINVKVISAMKTSPISVDLHKLLPNYYSMVEKWCLMFNDTILIENVMNMLKERAFEINNFANNANKQISNEFMYTLDEFEKKLFKKTLESNKLMRKWLKE
ncbi:PSF3 [[Candida] subhashii]|uniref:DNA replication complex GINS protein PSF3 n=1 Tax=[Candida] subhashii TaxID=561895 RepID=A0A8J5QBH7_9ASCO|nr:PSF3 [[Candida] subhashii]KAG7660582.1 PSF3 [[Candida] subhashii]